MSLSGRPRSASRITSIKMCPPQEKLLKKVFQDRAQLAAQREIVAAVGERGGLRTEYGQETTCRLCADRCPCRDKRLDGRGKHREKDRCRRCDESCGHVLRAECNEATRILKEELTQRAVQGITMILKPWELEQVRWTSEGDVTEASEGAVGKEVVDIIKPGDVDKWGA